MLKTKKIEMPCFQYLQGKENIALDVLGCIAKKQEINLETLLLLSHLYGYSFSLEQLESAKKNNDKYCEDILTTNETSNAICKVCKLSCNYMQQAIEQEETLLNHCLQKRNILHDTAVAYPPNTLSLQACIEIPSKTNDKMVIVPFFKKLYQNLCNDNEATIEQLSEQILEDKYSDETRSFIQKKIANMASVKLDDANEKEIINTILENLSCQDQDCKENNSSSSSSRNTLNSSNNGTSAPIDFDMSWSADKKEDNKKENIAPTQTPEQTADIEQSKECEYLSTDGYLFSNVNMENYKYKYVNDTKSQLSLKYELMANSDIAIEVVSLSETPGLLFYICHYKYFYFVPLHQLNTKIIKSFLKGVVRDKQRYIYTMFAIPLLYTLFSIDLYPVENLVSLYELYNIANGSICKEAKNIIRTVSSDFSVLPEEYIPYTMRYYYNVAKKYRHRYDKIKYKKYYHLLCKNHIFAMSYRLKKLDGTNNVYLQLHPQDATYNFLYDTEVTLKKPGKIVCVSYENPVSNHSRYVAAFSNVIEKMYTAKAYASYSFRILDCSDTSLTIFVSQQSLEAFLSLLHSLLIRSGQCYISDAPKVSIALSDNN